LFKYYEGSRLNVLNGIRAISILWVIYGHTMSMSIGYSLNIGTVEKNVLFDWKFLTVSSALYSVDTFFFVGGFILAYGFQK
jgi:peptidoglycan/LPS O-acetylase OafA/YrhL